jgi:hypothetical protein
MTSYEVTGVDLTRFGLPYVVYNNIRSRSVEELLPSVGSGLAILYETRPHDGHWVLALRSGPKKIEWFDSYGYCPDCELENPAAAFSAQAGPRLEPLLQDWLDRGYTVEYLGDQLQPITSQTCGRYVLLRWLGRRMSLKRFLKVSGFSHDLDANDEQAVRLSNPYLRR